MGFKDFLKWLDKHARESNDQDFRDYLEYERKRKAEEERQKRIYYDLEEIPPYESSNCCCANCYYLRHICDEYRCEKHNIKLTKNGDPAASRILWGKRCNNFFEG